MIRFHRRNLFFAGISACALLAGGSVRAEAAPAADAGGQQLTEIVVTAERRSEKANQIPTALTVLSGSELAQRGVNTLDDLKSQVPSLSVQDQGFVYFVNIRGIGLSVINPTSSSGIANYTDGFYIPHEAALGDAYYDLQQVEVFRGPQGTINGVNSTGGAIFLVSKKPDFSGAGGVAEAGVGNYGTRTANFAANLPVTDTFAMRIAGTYSVHDSYFKNIVAGDTNPSVVPSFYPGNEMNNGMRVSALWQPNASIEDNLKFEYSSRRSDGIPDKPFFDIYPQLFGVRLADPRLANPFTIDVNGPTKNDQDVYRVVNEFKAHLTDNILLRSLTGYQHLKTEVLEDLDGTSSQSVNGHIYFSENTFEQEINLISDNQGPINWVVGGFYMHDQSPIEFSIFNNAFNLHSLGGATAYAGFAEVKYQLNQSWQLTVGGRESFDTRTEVYSINGSSNIDLKVNSSKPTGRVAINFFPTPNSTIYASASRGYKSGGLNDTDPSVHSFAPETLTAYESGFKAPVLGRALYLQGAVFYYDYTGFQQAIFNPSTNASPIKNAKGATDYGFETQANGRLGSFGYDASVAYTHSTLGSLITRDARGLPGGASPTQDINVGGHPLEYAPEWNFTANAYYAFSIPQGSLTPSVQYTWVSKQYATIFDVKSFDEIAAYPLVNASLKYQTKGNMYVELYGRNLANKAYIVGQSPFLASGGVIYGTPRQFGVKVGATF
jgi:iron complex outermembrane receptor protein